MKKIKGSYKGIDVELESKTDDNDKDIVLKKLESKDKHWNERFKMKVNATKEGFKSLYDATKDGFETIHDAGKEDFKIKHDANKEIMEIKHKQKMEVMEEKSKKESIFHQIGAEYRKSKQMKIDEKIRLEEVAREEERILREQNEKLRNTKIIFSILLGIIGLICLIIGIVMVNKNSLWYMLIIFSLFSLGAILFIWLNTKEEVNNKKNKKKRR